MTNDTQSMLGGTKYVDLAWEIISREMKESGMFIYIL
jgi:hypothetical protein